MNTSSKKTRKVSSALRLAAIAGALAAISSLALGDEVILRDGTVYTGTIVSQNRRTVLIDTEVHGISTRLELDRRTVKSIVKGETNNTPVTDLNPADPGSITLPSITEPVEDTQQFVKRDGYNLIMEVPLKGGFGTEIYPLGVASSLAWAKEHGVTDVVFRINSGGGYGWCASDMVEIMNQYRGEIKMHMLIESAISASIWPSFACDTITMAPGSDFGGAVGYTINDTGSAEVDLKMNSIMSAKLESQADANGHSGYLVRAMILSSAAVYAYQQADGTWVFTDTLDGLPSEYDVIDGPDSVLTLTAKQAVKYGIVDAMTEGKSLEEFCKVQGIEKWDSVGDIGTELVERDVERSKTFQNKLNATYRAFYTELSFLEGRNRISTVGSSLQTMRRHLGTYKRMMKEAGELHMPSIISSFEDAIDVPFWESQIETRLNELKRLSKP